MKISKTENKDKKISFTDFLIKSVRADHGSDSILKMSKKDRVTSTPICSTGYDLLDEAIGVGGYPKGRVIEIYGNESSGKTTLCLHACAEIQKVGGIAAFIDAEHALDPVYAEKIGVDMEKLLLNQPDNGEQVFDIIESLITGSNSYNKEYKTSKPILIIVDSVAAMVPKAELEGSLEDGTGAGLGAHARLMSQGLRRLNSILKAHNAVVIFINQTRTKIGVVFGNPQTTTGGNALKFYSSMRMELFYNKKFEEGKLHAGKEFKIKIVKNKCAPPFRQCAGLIRFGVGIDKIWPVYNLLKSEGFIIRSEKTWHEIKDHPNIKKFAGYKGFRDVYNDNKAVIDNIYKECSKDG